MRRNSDCRGHDLHKSLKGLLDRTRQLPYAWKPRLSKKTSTVSLPRVSNVLLLVDHCDNRTESIHEVSAISRHMIIRFLRRDVSQLDSMKPVPTWPAVTTTGIVRPMSACFRQILQPSSSNNGDPIEFSNDNEKILKFQHWVLDCTVDLNDPLKNKS